MLPHQALAVASPTAPDTVTPCKNPHPETYAPCSTSFWVSSWGAMGSLGRWCPWCCHRVNIFTGGCCVAENCWEINTEIRWVSCYEIAKMGGGIEIRHFGGSESRKQIPKTKRFPWATLVARLKLYRGFFLNCSVSRRGASLAKTAAVSAIVLSSRRSPPQQLSRHGGRLVTAPVVEAMVSPRRPLRRGDCHRGDHFASIIVARAVASSQRSSPRLSSPRRASPHGDHLAFTIAVAAIVSARRPWQICRARCYVS